VRLDGSAIGEPEEFNRRPKRFRLAKISVQVRMQNDSDLLASIKTSGRIDQWNGLDIG
jgi:hypothetical protein